MWRMAYDEELAERIRGHLPDMPVTEQKMFGGLAFLVGGHMSVAASGRGGLMVRCDPAETERLVQEDGVTRMEMGGKEMDGWLRVTSAVGGVATYPGLADEPVSSRSWVVPGSGESAWYQVYYRNAAVFCTADTFNASNGYAITW